MPSRLVVIYWDKQDPASPGWVWRTVDDSGPLDAPDEASEGALLDAWRDGTECRPTDQVYIYRGRIPMDPVPKHDLGYGTIEQPKEEP